MDWIPGYNYGLNTSVNPVSQATIPLIDPVVWAAAGNTVGVREERANLKIIRIVGYFQFQWAGALEGTRSVVHRLAPAFQDQDLGVAVPAGLIVTGSADEVANEKFWGERRHAPQDIHLVASDFFTNFAHPYHMMYDLKVNQWVGEQFVPTWQVWNGDLSETIRAIHFFRLLVA